MPDNILPPEIHAALKKEALERHIPFEELEHERIKAFERQGISLTRGDSELIVKYALKRIAELNLDIYELIRLSFSKEMTPEEFRAALRPIFLKIEGYRDRGLLLFSEIKTELQKTVTNFKQTKIEDPAKSKILDSSLAYIEDKILNDK